jgi:hypothetical protein
MRGRLEGDELVLHWNELGNDEVTVYLIREGVTRRLRPHRGQVQPRRWVRQDTLVQTARQALDFPGRRQLDILAELLQTLRLTLAGRIFAC